MAPISILILLKKYLIEADEIHLTNVLYNLIDNAIKYTDEGEINILVSRDKNERLKVKVSDTGIGIPDDKLQHIFDSFTQADSSTTRQYGGTGLGLAICRNIVEAHGGQIYSKPGPDGGLIMTTTLPLET